MKERKTRVLLVEDDLNLGFMLQEYLEMEDFEVKLCRDGEVGLKTFRGSKKFDICILDVMLPKKDGFTLAQDIREKNDKVPILFLTAKSLKEDKLKGFGLGGDDYMTKPFDEEELVCRIQAILKRSNHSENGESIFEIGKYTFDASKQVLLYENQEDRKLTSKESAILKMLATHKNRILKREDALIEIWGENDYFHGRSFDVFITKLRKYLKKDENIKIENVHSVGFMLIIDKEA